MGPHPDFADVAWPRTFDLGAFQLTPLTAQEVEEDYAAVVKAGPLLVEIWEGWPEGLTLDENRVDLAWHDREFTLKRSFSWILRDAAGLYLGCFYVFPAAGARGTAEAVLWVGDVADRTAIAQAAYEALQLWLTKALPRDVDLTWSTSPALQAM